MTHIPMLSIDGTFMLPELFSIEPARPDIWKNRPQMPMSRKYIEASLAMSGEPPSQ